jgi:hypothetical protein
MHFLNCLKKNMKKKPTMIRGVYLIKVLYVLLLLAAASSCKKSNEVEAIPSIEASKVQSVVSNESLIKFLSITLDVQKSEIKFSPANDEFIVRGQLKFKRSLIEGHYNQSNIYQTTYGQ